jgi:lysophospholipase L1-like esterase
VAGEPSLPRWKRLLFAALPSLAMLPLAEAVLRFAMPDTEIRTALKRGGILRPYRPGTEADLVSPDFRVRYAINPWGFRDLHERAFTTRSTQPPPWRVLLLGDSFTEGYGVELSETYARRLEADGRFEAWNLGRMGASPLFYVLQAREYLPRLRPDVLVVQLFDNDLDENRFRRVPREPDGRVGALPASVRPREGVPGRPSDAWTGSALVQAYRRLARRLDGKPVPRLFVRVGSSIPAPHVEAATGDAERLFPWYDPARTEEWRRQLEEHETLLRQLASEVRPSGVPLVWAYVPHHRELEAGDAVASRAANPHYRLLARLAGELGVPFVDGVALFAAPGRDPEAYYHRLDQHWNAAGHALFADALGARLHAVVEGGGGAP